MYRTKKRFLWWPKTINGITKWLITAEWVEVLQTITCCRPGKLVKDFVPFQWKSQMPEDDWGYKDHLPRR